MKLRIQVDALDADGHEIYDAHRQLELDSAQLTGLLDGLFNGAETGLVEPESSDLLYALAGVLLTSWAASGPDPDVLRWIKRQLELVEEPA